MGLDLTGASYFWGDFVPGGKQNCKVKVRFMGNQPKHQQCHHSILLCNYHLFHNDALSELNFVV